MKKSKTDKILDDFDKALEQMDEDINDLLEANEVSYNNGWWNAMFWVSLFFLGFYIIIALNS